MLSYSDFIAHPPTFFFESILHEKMKLVVEGVSGLCGVEFSPSSLLF